MKNRSIREKIYRAFLTRASVGETDNTPVIKRILEIKNELCKMLGYNSIAEKSLASKMAPSGDTPRCCLLYIPVDSLLRQNTCVHQR